MRVAHFCSSLNPSRGGVSSGVISLAKQLTRHGIDNQIISFGVSTHQLESTSELKAQLTRIGVEYRYTSAKIENDYGIGSLNGLREKLATLPDPNLVVLHQIYTFSTLFGYVYSKSRGIPYVVMPHGSLTKYHEADNKLIKSFAKWLLISKVLRKASAIVVTCESERDDLKDSLKSKALQIRYGVEFDTTSPEKFKLPFARISKSRIVFSGRFDKKKNLPLLITAMPLILDSFPDLVLDIAGSGSPSEVDNAKRLVSSLKLGRHVHFHGWLNTSEMKMLLANTKLLVLPSENENFALVVAEALGAGVPCVVSKFVGAADIVKSHRAGEILDELTPASIAAGVIKVLQGDESMYRQAAIEAVKSSLDWSKVALQWKSLVSSLSYTKH